MPYKWLPYRQAHLYEKEAERLKVSAVARSGRGFMRQYAKAATAKAMRQRPVRGSRQTWGLRRDNFIKRMMAQYRSHPTYRRWLALVMWAYRPPGGVPTE
jgi:hypothetical protein